MFKQLNKYFFIPKNIFIFDVLNHLFQFLKTVPISVCDFDADTEDAILVTDERIATQGTMP